MKTLTIRKTGQPIIVDDDDFESLGRHTWHLTHKGYAATNIKVGPRYRTRFLHRILVVPPDGMMVDHINGNKLDNRRCNLRLLCNADNAAAARKLDSRNSTGFRGVYRHGKGFVASYRGKYIGKFYDLMDAVEAWRHHIATHASHLIVGVADE